MTEPDSAAVFAALAELARRYPHWRAGQVVANAAGWADADVYDIHDAHLLAAVREHLAGPDATVTADQPSLSRVVATGPPGVAP